jgi:fumarate hydratase subunit alpha
MEVIMREVSAAAISELVARLCIGANTDLNPDICRALQNGLAQEASPVGRTCLENLIRNATIAREEKMPICQDTGMAVVFAEYGQEVTIIGGDFRTAVDEGVRRGYCEGYLRKSVVRDPFDRVNTGDNTPAVIHTEIVPGDRLRK